VSQWRAEVCEGCADVGERQNVITDAGVDRASSIEGF